MKPDPASLRRIEDGYELPPGGILPEGEAVADADLPPELDDRTVAYILASRGPFEGLRRASSQLAGLLVLAAIGSRTAQGNPMLEMAIAAHAEAVEALRALTPTRRGAHHHHHLLLAADRLGEALAKARHSLQLTDSVADIIQALMKFVLADLRWASRALPGFELVNFAQGCCAMHSASLQTATKKTLRVCSAEEVE